MDTVINLENVSVIHFILEISVIVLSVVKVAINIMDTASENTFQISTFSITYTSSRQNKHWAERISEI